jgi:ligand-binding sensor domain-containing protein
MPILRLRICLHLLILMFLTSCNAQPKTKVNEEKPFRIVDAQTEKLKATIKYANLGSAIQDRFGNIWLTSAGDGIYFFDGKSFTHYTTEDGLDNNIVHSIFEDRQGNIWVGSKTGLNLLKTDKDSPKGVYFSTIPTNFSAGNIHSPVNLSGGMSVKQNGVWDMMQDKDGVLWIGTDDGVFCYDGKFIKPFLDNEKLNNEDSLQLKAIFSILQDTKGHIWFAACVSEGVSKYDGKTLSNIIPHDSIRRTDHIVEDKNGILWFAAVFTGMGRYDGKEFKSNYFNESTIRGPSHILIDHKSNFWFNTYAGLGFYDGTTFKVFTERDGLPDKNINPLMQDKSGNIWFNGPDMSLYSFDGKTFVKYSE